MANNPLPPLPRGTDPALEQWLLKAVIPRITKPEALLWNQFKKAGSDVNDLETPETTESTDHREAASAHGATGDLVGSGNFATDLKGGVVKQTGVIADISTGTLTIGGTYNQTQVNAVATATKNTSNKVDELLAALRSAGIVGE